MALLGECRCCRKPISRSRLACPPHWAMLPKPLKDAIFQTYSRREWRVYAANVTEADKIWQAAGIWKPPVPMSRRAQKGVASLRSLIPAQPEDKEARTEAWPTGCHSPNSCTRHMACMYTNCRYENRPIKAEIEAALKDKEAREDD